MKKILSKAPFLAIVLVLLYFGGKFIYKLPKFDDGAVAPQFSAQLLNGEAFKLSDLEGKYVLLDFWGSWCAPCRKENPNLVKFYDKFHPAKFKDADGFEVVSVGIEKRKASWEKAIEKDGLKWKYHIPDLATNLRFFNSEIAAKFGVKEVPTKYLLNQKGHIIGVNLSFEEMDQLLTNSMSSN